MRRAAIDLSHLLVKGTVPDYKCSQIVLNSSSVNTSLLQGFSRLWGSNSLIFTDGAANKWGHLVDSNRSKEVHVVGDLDSVDHSSLSDRFKVLQDKCQNSNDLDKACKLFLEREAVGAETEDHLLVINGFTEGRLDHQM